MKGQEHRLSYQTLAGHQFNETSIIELHAKRISNEILCMVCSLGYTGDAVVGVAGPVVKIWREFGVRYWAFDALDYVLQVLVLQNSGQAKEDKDYDAMLAVAAAAVFCVDRAVVHARRNHVAIAENWLSCAQELRFFRLSSGYDLQVLMAKTGANARHSKPGGSWEKQAAIRDAWATGKYTSRDICAEQESAAIGMSFSSARKALRGTPDPT